MSIRFWQSPIITIKSGKKENSPRRELGFPRPGLVILWIVVAVLVTGCREGEDPLHALFGYLLLLVCTAFIISLAVVLATKSPSIAGCFIGLFISFIIEITLPSTMQFMLIGGMLGISLDKVTTKTAADLPVTVVDRLATLVTGLADAIKEASSETANAVSIASVRRGVWAAVLSVLTTMLLGKAADSLGLSGTNILTALH